jgi:hypothetical protein
MWRPGGEQRGVQEVNNVEARRGTMWMPEGKKCGGQQVKNVEARR